MFYRDERLALFIDGSNLYAAAKALGFDIDYKLLRQEFMRRGKLLRAFYYTALLENEEYSPIRPLVDWLHYNGFAMVTKPAKEYTDSQGRRKVKGNMDIEKPPLTLYLAAPRGFCAGVDRAIKIVEMALEKWGAPVYVRHEIVHNRHVVDACARKRRRLRRGTGRMPARPPGDLLGPRRAEIRAGRGRAPRDGLSSTPPARWSQGPYRGRTPLRERAPDGDDRPCRPPREVIGTMGQLPPARCCWSRRSKTWRRPRAATRQRLAFITQTTLSVDDTAGIVAALQARFPAITGPHKEDICYATTNRQAAVKAVAPEDRRTAGDRRAKTRRTRKRLVEVGRDRRLRLFAADRHARRRHRLARARRHPQRSASPPAPAAPEVLVERGRGGLPRPLRRDGRTWSRPPSSASSSRFRVCCASLHDRLARLHWPGRAARLGPRHLHDPTPARRTSPRRLNADRRATGRGRDQ
jgi:hypothetical protein